MNPTYSPRGFLSGPGIVRALALVGSVSSLMAGSFVSDFNASLPGNAHLFGDTGDGNAGVREDGVIKLTKAVGSQSGSLIIDDLDGGKSVQSFTADFKLRVGNGGGADGFSFSFANDLPDGPIGEEGAGSGLTVSFDTYDNGGGEAPAIDIKKGGQTVATVKGVLLLFRKDNWVQVSLKVAKGGALSLSIDGTRVYDNVVGAFTAGPGRFAFGARTGGSFDNHWIDDVSIATDTVAATVPVVSAASPQGGGVGPTPVIDATIDDSVTKVAEGSVQVLFNGAAVTAQVARQGSQTRVSYDPPGLLPSGSTNRVELRFNDTASPASPQVFQWSFVVAPYAVLSANLAIPAAQVDRTKPGFTVRPVKARIDSVFVPSLAPYEALLNGLAIDGATGAPYENTANLSGADNDGAFVEDTTIDYSDSTATAGNFQTDHPFPGIPGSDGFSDRFAEEILTYLELPAGNVTLGVNSDDGFKVSVGSPDPRSAFNTVLGFFDGSRGPADSLFSFVVEQAGVYAVRLMHFDSSGGAALEFFSVLPDGTKVLVNDTATPGALKAYRARAANAPALPPFIVTASPRAGETEVSIKPKIEILVRDSDVVLDPTSIQLSVDGKPVTPTVSKNGFDTLISHRPETALPGSSVVKVVLSYKSTTASALPVSQAWDFTTAAAPNLGTGLLALKVNFQNSSSEGFPGYQPDNGLVFGDRGNGYSYGWNKDNSANARNRNQTDLALAPDERYDTFNHMQKAGGPWVWEVALPNGTYQVHIVGGEPNNFDQTIRIKAEDTLVVNGAPCTTTERFREGTAVVKVEDGRLTVTASESDGAVNCKIAFMEIRSLVRVNFQNSSSEGFPGYLPDNGLVFGDRGNGYSYGWNLDNSANARNRNQTDLALAPDERYDTFNHMQKPGGPWNWNMGLPNGTYSVHIVGGEPNNFDQTIRIKAEDTLVVNGAPCTTTERFREGTALVKVEDGRLTVTASEADGAVNCKIAFLELAVEELAAATVSGPTVKLQVPAGLGGSAVSNPVVDTAAKTVTVDLPPDGSQGFFTLTPSVKILSLKVAGNKLTVKYE